MVARERDLTSPCTLPENTSHKWLIILDMLEFFKGFKASDHRSRSMFFGFCFPIFEPQPECVLGNVTNTRLIVLDYLKVVTINGPSLSSTFVRKTFSDLFLQWKTPSIRILVDTVNKKRVTTRFSIRVPFPHVRTTWSNLWWFLYRIKWELGGISGLKKSCLFPSDFFFLFWQIKRELGGI